MKNFRVRYTLEAVERIRKLHPQVKQEIREGIRQLVQTPTAGRPLLLELSGYWPYRVRTYRIIYQINDVDRALDVVFVGPRRNVYQELIAALLEHEKGAVATGS